MKNLFRFTGILVVSLLAIMGTLAVAGVLSSSDFTHSATKILEIVGIGLAASVIVMLIAKKS